MERKGDWITTYSGIHFYPLDAREDEINIHDIAHSLSLQCRFAGHCNKFYSVAEHSCHIFDTATKENALWGLLHDATEAYLVDLPRPVKNSMPIYKTTENRLMEIIASKYGLIAEMPSEIKKLDIAILFAEAKQNMNSSTEEWKDQAEPLDIKLRFWNPKKAEVEFMSRFDMGRMIQKWGNIDMPPRKFDKNRKVIPTLM